MGLLSAALTTYSAIADTIAVVDYINRVLISDGSNAQDLFAQCFTRAVVRNQPSLARLTEAQIADGVAVDKERLKLAITKCESAIDANILSLDGSSIYNSMAPYFVDAIVLPGHQLTTDDLRHRVANLLQQAFDDFFTQLPANSVAMADSTLSFIRRADVEHQRHTKSLESMRDDLKALKDAQEQILSRVDYLNPILIQQESTRAEFRNPFRIVKAEDFNHDYARLAMLFKEPASYENLRGPDNLIIAGGRGCGKSMLLRSLSAPTAFQLHKLKSESSRQPIAATWKESNLEYFGVYIKLARGYFHEWSPDSRLTPDAATQLFQHIFNMILLRSLLQVLIDARSTAMLSIPAHVEHEIVKSIADFAGFDVVHDTFEELIKHTRREERHVGDYMGVLRLGLGPPTYAGSHTYIHNFLDFCCKSVNETIPDLNRCRIFFLLDEYENLSESQQKTVNTLAKLRPLSLSLKIAARALGVKSVVDLQGEPMQCPRDYQVVELDYKPNDANYLQLLYDIATKRLEAENFSAKDINKLLAHAPLYHPTDEKHLLAALGEFLNKSESTCPLPEVIESAKREKLHQWSVALVFRLAPDVRRPFTYAGFQDFADLSSGIISSFLEFCKLAFYLAQASGIDVRSGTPIPWKIQNEAVYTASRAYFDYIEKNIPETGAEIARLVLDVADIFREKLYRHGSEPESARITISDPSKLDGETYRRVANVLDDAVRWSVMHAVGQANAYFPKHKTEVRSNDYLLNRVLAPILRISPRPRWPTSFSADELRRLNDSDTRRVARNELRTKHSGSVVEVPDDESLFPNTKSTNENT